MAKRTISAFIAIFVVFGFFCFTAGAYLGSEEKFDSLKQEIKQAYWSTRADLGLLPEETCEWPCYEFDADSIDLSFVSWPEEGETGYIDTGLYMDESVPYNVSDKGDYLSLKSYIFAYYRDPMSVSVWEERISKDPGVYEALKNMGRDAKELKFHLDGNLYTLVSIEMNDGTYLYKK